MGWRWWTAKVWVAGYGKDGTDSSFLLPTDIDDHPVDLVKPKLCVGDCPKPFSDWQDYIPHYSTKISSAWQVVTAMEETHHWQLETLSDSDAPYWVGITAHGGSGFKPDHYSLALTMPEAICLVALAAKGVGVKKKE